MRRKEWVVGRLGRVVVVVSALVVVRGGAAYERYPRGVASGEGVGAGEGAQINGGAP